jgi:hypothetical protein
MAFKQIMHFLICMRRFFLELSAKKKTAERRSVDRIYRLVELKQLYSVFTTSAGVSPQP